jgi:anthranilate/para-aminobenzoate synthase component I
MQRPNRRHYRGPAEAHAAGLTAALSATSISPGNMNTCIALRTIVWKNGVYDVQASAGVVADSIPSSEFEETMSKAQAGF